MNYRVMKQHTFERIDALELHLLARAYYAAWKRVHQSEPIHEHAIPSLNLLIYFEPVRSRTQAATDRETRAS
jgi:hypothetical protein